MRRIESLKNGSEIIGNRTRAKVVKNKVAPPFRQAEFDIMFGEGIAHEGELIDLGVQLELVRKSGSWFSMGETRIGQGRDAAKQFLRDNPELAQQLEADIRANADKLTPSRPVRPSARAAAPAHAAPAHAAAAPAPAAAAARAAKAVDVTAEDFEDADQ